MSLVVSCPRCGDEVTLPSRSAEDSLVQCPYCAEVYPLAEVRRGLPPALVVVGRVASSPVGRMHPDHADSLNIALDVDADRVETFAPDALDDDFRLAPPVAEPRPFVASESASATRSTPPKRSSSRPAVRRTSSSHPLREIVKIVAGGIVGLTIGQLILWWMPGNWNLSNRDPAGVGAKIGIYLPWLVPLEVRGEPRSFSPLTEDDSRPLVDLDSTRSLNENGEGGTSERVSPDFSGFDFLDSDADSDADSGLDANRLRSLDVDPIELLDLDDRERNASPFDSDAAQPEGSMPREERSLRDEPTSDDNEPRRDEDATTEEALSDEPKSDEPKSDEPSHEDLVERPSNSSGSLNAAPPATRTTAVRQAPTYEPAQLSGVVAELRDALGGWSDGDPETRASIVYAALARTSMVVPFTDAAQPESRQAVAELRRLLGDIGRDPEQLEAVADQAASVPLAERSTQEGTFVTGVVQRVETRGRLFAMTLQRNGGETIDIISTVDPAGRLATGRPILALGITILHPRMELIGYDGPMDPVLYGALVVPVGR